MTITPHLHVQATLDKITTITYMRQHTRINPCQT
jgi:hypothetical protein